MLNAMIQVLVCAGMIHLGNAQCQGPYQWPTPTPWPAEHFHKEIEYDTQAKVLADNMSHSVWQSIVIINQEYE